MTALNFAPLSLSISAVERDTGLSKDTLRVWERRYGFPTPQRDAQGERMYSFEQLEKLRLIKRLLDAGHRPGHVVAQPTSRLQQLIDQFNQPFMVERRRARQTPPPTVLAELNSLLDRIRADDVPGVRRELGRAVARSGLQSFIFDLAAPLLNQMNDARMRGTLQRYQELWVRECLETLLRTELATMPMPPADARPRMVLATLPNEPRGLGRLMVQGLATLDGANCLNLGQQVPVFDIAQATVAYQADIVVICYSIDAAQGPLLSALRELRDHLPPGAELWVASTNHTALRQPIQGVQVLTQPADLTELVHRWSHLHPASH